MVQRLAILLFVIFSLAPAQEIGARYLIITHDNFYDAIQPLAEWKHKKGMRTKIAKLSDIGSSASQIKTYISNAYNTWQIQPEFLLLVGAPNYLPWGQSSPYSDNYYTDMEGNLFNEILSGRLTVHNTNEAENVVNKILLYEKTPHMEDSLWMINACLIVREDYNNPSTGDDSIYWSDIRHAKNYMLQYEYNIVDTLSKMLGDDANDVLAAVNDGRAFVLFRGQGVGNWWSPFSVNPDLTQNGPKLPIVLSITCRTIGTGSTPAEAEKWLLTGSVSVPRGGAGYFATTTTVVGHADYRSAVCKGFFDALFDEKKRTFGEACEGGRTNVYHLYSNSSEYRGFTTLGDPEMNIWTAIPRRVEVVHTSPLYVGSESLHVRVNLNSVPYESAQVCVVLDTVVYEYGHTTSTGDITFYFDNLIPGEMDLTVTGKNIYPYETKIPVIDSAAYLTYSGHTINDSLANNNGLPENGETILLHTILTNSGLAMAHNVLAELSSDDTLVSVIDALAHFEDIYPGDSSFGLSPFVFSISPFCPSGHVIDFTLSMEDANGGTWLDDFSIGVGSMDSVIGPDLYGYYIYDDTDTSAGNAPVFDWFEIAPPGPGIIISEITNEDADTVTYPLPFNFKYYGIDYSSIGICSNGFLELDYATYRFGDNGPIPLAGGPKKMLAPFWDDLNPDPNTNNGYGDIYYYNDTENHRWIIEFKDCAHYTTPSQRETFQVILLDPQYYPTPTGDGEILYLYATVSNATSNTVGMEDHFEVRGLEYLYEDNYNSNAAPLVNGRALLITTLPPGSRMNTPWLYTMHYAINDSAGGNNNGLVEPNEIIDIYVTIKNDGDTTAHGVVGTLHTDDSDATLLDSISNFGDIVAGATGNNYNDVYTVQISDTPTDSTIGFTLDFDCNDGTYHKKDYFTIYLYGLYGTEETHELDDARCYGLQIYPNPCRNGTHIKLSIGQGAQDIELKIYDVTGRLVKNFSHLLSHIPHQSSVMWDGTDEQGRRVADGIYFLHLNVQDYSQIKKVILIK